MYRGTIKQAIASDLEMPYEMVKTYAKLAHKKLKTLFGNDKCDGSRKPTKY
jgi:hypothetical protein